MRRRFRPAGEEASVDMTPMLDIVFIMLIFFIVAAVFLDERGIVLSEAPNAPPSPISLPAIAVTVDKDDGVRVDGERVQLTSAFGRVEALRADKPQAAVILTAHSASSVEAVVRLKDGFDRASVPVTLKIAPQRATSSR